MLRIFRCTKSPRVLSVAMVTLFALAMVAVTGCPAPEKKSTGSAKPMTEADIAAGKRKAMEDIRNNPNIPAAQKTKILAQMEGKFKPSVKSEATPGTAPQ